MPFAESTSGATYSTFFYSNSYALDNLDDRLLHEVIAEKYPELLESEKDLNTKRHATLRLLEDTKFMDRVLEAFSMQLPDFLKFLFRLCPSMFRGIFVRQV